MLVIICSSARALASQRPECEKQNAGMVGNKSHSGKGPKEREIVVPIPSTYQQLWRRRRRRSLIPCSLHAVLPQESCSSTAGGKEEETSRLWGIIQAVMQDMVQIPCRDLIFLFLLVLNRIPLVNL